MTGANEAARLDIVAEAQDRVSATLNGIQSEVDETTARVNRMGATAAASSDRMVKAAGAQAESTSRATSATREATAASETWSGAAKGKLEGLAKVKEGFEKYMGALAFLPAVAGLAAGALAALGVTAETTAARLRTIEGVVTAGGKAIEEVTRAVAASDVALRTYSTTVARAAQDWRTLNEIAAEGAAEMANKAISDLYAAQAVALASQMNAQSRLVMVSRERADLEERYTADLKGKTLEEYALLDVGISHRGLQEDVLKVIRLQREAKSQIAASDEDILRITKQRDVLESRVAASVLAGANGVGNTLAKLRAAPQTPPKFGPGSPDTTLQLMRQNELLLVRGDLQRAEIEYYNALADAGKLRRESEREQARRQAQIKIELAEEKALAASANAEYADERAAQAVEERTRALGRQLTIAKAANDEQKVRLETEYEIRSIEAQRQSGALNAEGAGMARELAERKQRGQLIDLEARRIERLGRAATIASRPLNMLSEGLGGVTDAIAETAAVWAKYESGQASLAQTIASSLGAMGAGIAGAIKDKRAQAGVEGAFETAASIASFAGQDYPGGIAHAAAAAAFFAVAAGAGSSSGSAGGAGGRAKIGPANDNGRFGQAADSSRPQDKREVVIVQYERGIVYGLGSEVAKVAAATGLSLRGTNMQQRRF